MPRRNFAEVLLGAVVLLVAAGFLAYAIAHSGRTTTTGYQLYAKFDHIDGLTVGGDVRVAGVKVGSIDSATLDPTTYQAVVGFTVADNVKLPKDSSAVITSESLLGGKYLALSPGGDEAMLQPGQAITITQGSINIEELLGKFIFSASSLTGAKSSGQGGGQAGGLGSGHGDGQDGAAGGGAVGGGAVGGGAAGGGAVGGTAGSGSGAGLPPLGGQPGSKP
jgi:phospholipid/cholesterol/gamma-HCH transport system substrate-binding protein